VTLGRNDLRPYQHRAVEWIKSHDNCALWLDMGLGKTTSTLTAYADLLASFDVRRALVIAPLRVARRVWTDEIAEWSHLNHITASRAIGPAAKRWLALKRPADIHLINRENVQWLEAQIIQGKKQVRRWPWDLVILDESQSFRSQSSGRFKALRKLRKLIPRMIQLTGTPSPNGYKNLWAQMYLLDQGQRLGGTEEAYHNRWFDNEQAYPGSLERRRVLKPGAKEEIEARLSDIVIAMKADDYLDLPPVRYNVVKVDLSESERKTYKRLEREALAEVRSKTITAVNAGVAFGKLLQLANGAIYYEDKRWVEFHREKLDALVELVDGIDTPIIVCYAFKHDLARILEALKVTGKRIETAEDDASFDRWDKGEVDVIVLHPASAGHGLNMQHAGSRDIIWFGLTADLEMYDQANARLIGGHRRREGITIHLILTAGTKDEDARRLLESKDDVQVGLMRAIARLATGP
jgi:SNF2 family DNA or RNA helicase